MFSPALRRIVAILLSVGAYVAFLWIYGSLLYRVWKALPDSYPETNENLKYVGITLAGLVSGVVARGFGIPPKEQSPGTSSIVRPRLIGLGAYVTGVRPQVLAEGGEDSVRTWIGAAYVFGYFTVGAIALGLWAASGGKEGTEVPEMVSSVAFLTLGMGVAIVTEFLRGNDPD